LVLSTHSIQIDAFKMSGERRRQSSGAGAQRAQSTPAISPAILGIPSKGDWVLFCAEEQPQTQDDGESDTSCKANERGLVNPALVHEVVAGDGESGPTFSLRIYKFGRNHCSHSEGSGAENLVLLPEYVPGQSYDDYGLHNHILLEIEVGGIIKLRSGIARCRTSFKDLQEYFGTWEDDDWCSDAFQSLEKAKKRASVDQQRKVLHHSPFALPRYCGQLIYVY
jgi:hypothetical protein